MQAVDPFSRWWNDPIKHYKRRYYWLPQARRLHRQLNGQRSLRYFTLCSREMIDVFCFIKEKLLSYDMALHRINNVTFCEVKPSNYPEIIEMLGVENSGFLGRLENISLYEDDAYTKKFPSERDIDVELSRVGESISKENRERLDLKRNRLRFEQAFPFDFLNLDFCDVYYPPPDTMRINSTIEQMVKWQTRLLVDNGNNFLLQRFLLAVTCRFDDSISKDAFDRLKAVLVANKLEYPQYRIALDSDNLRRKLTNWRRKDPLDFFLSAWPKELLRIMERNQWKMEIPGFVFYRRIGESGRKYIIASLLCECARQPSLGTHEAQSLWLLDKGNRRELKKLSKSSGEGRRLYSDLKAIVALRNRQAKFRSRPLLPAV